jgi:osmotically-inducible protein OsmY
MNDRWKNDDRHRWEDERYRRRFYAEEGPYGGGRTGFHYDDRYQDAGYRSGDYDRNRNDFGRDEAPEYRRSESQNYDQGSYDYDRQGRSGGGQRQSAQRGSDNGMRGNDYQAYERGYGPYASAGYGGIGGIDRGIDYGLGGSQSGQRSPSDHDDWQHRNERAASGHGHWFGHERTMGQHSGRGPKGYTRSDDRIRDDISDRLTDDPWLDASDIEITVVKGEITLTGMVGSRHDKRRAEDLAESVSGANHVQNNLRVRSGTEASSNASQASSGQANQAGSSSHGGYQSGQSGATNRPQPSHGGSTNNNRLS